MGANIPQAVRDLIVQYRRFLKTSYRFLDPHLRDQFEAHLAGADVIVRGPYVTLARDYEKGSSLSQIAAAGGIVPELLQAHWPFSAERLFLHQEQALERGRTDRSFVITTGTGSGKTEAFLLPVLDGILRRKAQGLHGVQAILLYPMNALANDQLERLRRLLRGSGLDLSYSLYTGDSDEAGRSLQEESGEQERRTRDATRRAPPDLLLTNYKQLEFLLIRREDRRLFTPSLRYLVLDELHSYRGALAAEIACLIRRLKAHAGLKPGELVCIGTSATVTSAPVGTESLAEFGSSLFGEKIASQDIIGETLIRPAAPPAPWVPPLPALQEQDLSGLDPDNDAAVVALAEHLTGRSCPPGVAIGPRIAAQLQGNRIVHALEELCIEACSLDELVAALRERLPERSEAAPEQLRLEIEAYLLVASIGDEENPPLLRPKLHTFFHGVYDVSLCTNPACRTLVPQGGAQCSRCGSVARPAALCRTCGQDFVKLRREREDDERPVGTADFFSDENTLFLTHEVHQLAGGEGQDEEEEGQAQAGEGQRRARARRREEVEEKLEPVGFCIACGRLLAVDESCPSCNLPTVRMLMHSGKLNTCPACGDMNSRTDIVTPLRTGTASTVAVLATHHLDHLRGTDRKLLVFADNRQDTAHQAGYTEDKHRAFALRHMIFHQVILEGERGLYLEELPQRLLDEYGRLGIAPIRPARHERDRWLDALTWESANEFTRNMRQRASLENLGLIGVDYEFLSELLEEQRFTAAAARAGLTTAVAFALTRAVLDVMRRNRAVAYDFFQQYVDPERTRRYRELEAEPYNIRFPERDRSPKAFALDRPDHIRAARRLLGFTQENPRAGQLTAAHKLAARLIGDRGGGEQFLKAVVPLLEDKGIIVPVNFPIPARERTPGLQPLQIAPRVLRLYLPAQGFRCNACQTWRPYNLPICPTARCTTGTLVPRGVDEENYYVRLYRDRPPQRLRVEEHSAQISGEERAKRETEFKQGRLDALMCTPTLELGVDIGPLLTVVLRNAPPTPTNYAQRVGRAGRRLRIGFASTFCAGGSHDRHAFEQPSYFVAGRFDPPRLRLDNPKIVTRHLRSFLLECLDTQLPTRLGELLDDPERPTRWRSEELAALLSEIRSRREELIQNLALVMAEDRRTGLVQGYDQNDAAQVVDEFETKLNGILSGWWQRVQHLDREYQQYSAVGAQQADIKKANARRRAFLEITKDPERAYTLNYLSTYGLLPAYQFPLDSFSLDPGVTDTPTLYRSAAIAIEEFAPGNYVYANGRKLRSIRVLFPGGPGSRNAQPGPTDAATSGRLEAFHFCEQCEEVVESGRNQCPRCQSPLPAATNVVFVDAFEAEENLKISSEEESRQRQSHERRESLVFESGGHCQLFSYPLTPVELVRLAQILITNWGRVDGKTGRGSRFMLCPDCGRHLPYNPNDQAHAEQIRKWNENHSRFCQGQPASLVLAYRYQADCLLLSLPSREDITTIGRFSLSPTLATAAEALLAGASSLLELETGELAAFIRKSPSGAAADQIVFYETVPGGAGYLEQVARRLPEVAASAMERLYGHACRKSCYLCLKHYGNQRWHSFFDKDAVRDLLFTLAGQEPVEAQPVEQGQSLRLLERMLADRRENRDPLVQRYPKGAIEEPLFRALSDIPGLPLPVRDFEIHGAEGQLITVPDFTWADARIAVFCDGFAYHGNPQTLELDARKRNYLQSQGWIVLTYWGRTILKDPAACGRQIAEVYRERASEM